MSTTIETLHQLRYYLEDEKVLSQLKNHASKGIVRSRKDLATLIWQINPELDLSYSGVAYELSVVDQDFPYVENE